MENKVNLAFKDGNIAILTEGNRFSPLNAFHYAGLNFFNSHKLANIDGIEYWASEIANKELSLPENAKLIPLRQALALLEARFFSIISKASQIISWDKTHQFCGVCGNPTQQKQTILEKYCPNCNSVFYPRICPSIIVLIKKEDEILMARSPHFPPGAYSLIAGFVEPGENVEQALHREVFEEVGITVKNLRYLASQSWPFPNSLMLGFIADYDSGNIIIDNVEIESAGWYKAQNLPQMTPLSFQISISSQMIQAFIDNSL